MDPPDAAAVTSVGRAALLGGPTLARRALCLAGPVRRGAATYATIGQARQRRALAAGRRPRRRCPALHGRRFATGEVCCEGASVHWHTETAVCQGLATCGNLEHVAGSAAVANLSLCLCRICNRHIPTAAWLPRCRQQAIQESENDKAEIVIVCEPEGMSLQARQGCYSSSDHALLSSFSRLPSMPYSFGRASGALQRPFNACPGCPAASMCADGRLAPTCVTV